MSEVETATKAINESLRDLYLGAWGELSKSRKLSAGMSNPLLVKATDAYVTARVRILFVGQQTDTWYNELVFGTDREAVDGLMNVYDSFALAIPFPTRRRSPFWRACYQLHDDICSKTAPRGFLWTDVVKVDQNRRRPDHQLESRLAALNLLVQEINILRPDVVIFTTGPNYDLRIGDALPGVRFLPVSERHPIRHIARLEHANLPASSIRMYHPNYLQRSGMWDEILVACMVTAESILTSTL